MLRHGMVLVAALVLPACSLDATGSDTEGPNFAMGLRTIVLNTDRSAGAAAMEADGDSRDDLTQLRMNRSAAERRDALFSLGRKGAAAVGFAALPEGVLAVVVRTPAAGERIIVIDERTVNDRVYLAAVSALRMDEVLTPRATEQRTLEVLTTNQLRVTGAGGRRLISFVVDYDATGSRVRLNQMLLDVEQLGERDVPGIGRARAVRPR